MIWLYTDFGSHDLYVGQMKAAIWQRAPGMELLDLLHEVPDFDIRCGAHLLAALMSSMPMEDVVVLAVVDPGVGSARRPVVMQADGRWYVGPDNGLLSVLAQQSHVVRLWEIEWRPPTMSHAFHGRDLFAPIAAMLATGTWWPGALREIQALGVRLETAGLYQILYVDHYGNAMTGIRAGVLGHGDVLEICGQRVSHARVFSDVPCGVAFWHENSIGLVEIAVNRGDAALRMGLQPGMPLSLVR